MNKKLILWAVTVGLGGLLFGLDVAVISGAEKTIQKLWGLSDFMHGVAIAMAIYGTIFGAALGGIPADRFGRRPTLIWVGILFFISAVGSAIANDVNTFMFFRFIGGLSIGASSVVAPVYISEIAPPQYRGRMVISFQANIVFGILVAYLSNYLLDNGGSNDWRWMLGIVGIPSLLFSLFMMLTPETPRWLLLFKKDEAAARKVLSEGNFDVEAEIEEIKSSTRTQPSEKEPFFSKKYSYISLLIFLFAFFNQASGINAIIYFSKRVFEMAGMGDKAALLGSVGVGVVNMAFTILGWYLIDRFGRRALMYIGSIGYISSLALVTYSFLNAQFDFVPYYIFAFIASHAIGQGAVIWVFISEISPNAVRASGMALGSFTHWIFAALLTTFFPAFAEKFGGGPIFLFFTVMMVFQLIYVWRMMPETKGVSLEDLQERLVR
jgi:MFS transporter, SP family, arabinose:H+ symporter